MKNAIIAIFITSLLSFTPSSFAGETYNPSIDIEDCDRYGAYRTERFKIAAIPLGDDYPVERMFSDTLKLDESYPDLNEKYSGGVGQIWSEARDGVCAGKGGVPFDKKDCTRFNAYDEEFGRITLKPSNDIDQFSMDVAALNKKYSDLYLKYTQGILSKTGYKVCQGINIP